MLTGFNFVGHNRLLIDLAADVNLANSYEFERRISFFLNRLTKDDLNGNMTKWDFGIERCVSSFGRNYIEI